MHVIRTPSLRLQRACKRCTFRHTHDIAGPFGNLTRCRLDGETPADVPPIAATPVGFERSAVACAIVHALSSKRVKIRVWNVRHRPYRLINRHVLSNDRPQILVQQQFVNTHDKQTLRDCATRHRRAVGPRVHVRSKCLASRHGIADIATSSRRSRQSRHSTSIRLVVRAKGAVGNPPVAIDLIDANVFVGNAAEECALAANCAVKVAEVAEYSTLAQRCVSCRTAAIRGTVGNDAILRDAVCEVAA